MMLTTLRRPSSRRSAFTLLEVLVVVAILVILATVATIATTRYIEEARKSKAQLGCATIDKAIKAYTLSSANPGLTEEDKLPQGPQDLIQPFGSASSLLENGVSDITDPWGKQYQFKKEYRADQSPYIIVYTTAPDGTTISQYGIGANSQPKTQ